MRILLNSHRFYPDIGGIESVSMLLAQSFAKSGHDVVLVTQSLGSNDPAWPFQVIRRPRCWELFWFFCRSQLIFHNHLSLQTAWPLLILRRPWVVTLQTWLPQLGWVACVKRWSLRFAKRLYISEAIGTDAGLPGTVIGNPYDADVFRFPEIKRRDKDLIYVGRLVSDKGVDLILQALALLREHNKFPSLSVVGGGDEEAALKRQTTALRLENQVKFVGPLSGKKIAALLQQHRLLVVPSRWAEPFGIVALEGIACGCKVVASNQGGLPEAVGPCGVTFPNGNVNALAECIEAELAVADNTESLRVMAEQHLSRFRLEQVVASYLKAFKSLL